EDGIRDRNVTGVQTCALPIFDVDGDDLVGGEKLGDIVAWSPVKARDVKRSFTEAVCNHATPDPIRPLECHGAAVSDLAHANKKASVTSVAQTDGESCLHRSDDLGVGIDRQGIVPSMPAHSERLLTGGRVLVLNSAFCI